MRSESQASTCLTVVTVRTGRWQQTQEAPQKLRKEVIQGTVEIWNGGVIKRNSKWEESALVKYMCWALLMCWGVTKHHGLCRVRLPDPTAHDIPQEVVQEQGEGNSTPQIISRGEVRSMEAICLQDVPHWEVQHVGRRTGKQTLLGQDSTGQWPSGCTGEPCFWDRIDWRVSLSHNLGLATSYTVGFSGVQLGKSCLWVERPSLV